MNNHTAKHFVLQLGSLISLYLSVAFFITLAFGFINLQFPDSLDGIWQIESAASSIRIGFAMVLVFFPTYLILTRMVNKNRRLSSDSSYLGLTKWLIYLSLLVGGLVLLGDLVAIIIGFLEGELTTRFILKAFVVFAVTGAAFFYYIRDAQGYWLTHEKHSYVYAIAASLLVVATLGAAISVIPNPTTVREMKVDNQMIGDLQDMQWRIEDYYRTNDTLRSDLAALYGEFPVPTPPEGKPPYAYATTSDSQYQLCATFTHDMTTAVPQYAADKISIAPGMPGNYNWDYQAGEWCFDRVIESNLQR